MNDKNSCTNFAGQHGSHNGRRTVSSAPKGVVLFAKCERVFANLELILAKYERVLVFCERIFEKSEQVLAKYERVLAICERIFEKCEQVLAKYEQISAIYERVLAKRRPRRRSGTFKKPGK